jgi:CubicO group peptidase (beta-lactamase class C family)
VIGRLFVLLLVILSGGLVALAQPRTAGIDAYLSRLEKYGQWSGAVLIAVGDRIVLRRGYGLADRESRTPFTPQTRHQVASVSKMFTAMATLKLRDAGKLRLEDSICVYLEHCPSAWQTITVQHLMRHTSGIPDYETPLGLYTPKYLAFMTRPDATKRILENARTQALEFTPGSRFQYSNTGYIVLSSIIERVSGLPFNTAIRALVLEPAGLQQSGMLEPDSSGVSSGYTRGWSRVPRLALMPPAGDAALVSTLDDLYRWSRIMDGSAFVGARESAEVFTPSLGGYGYGWFVDSRFQRTRYIHTGELPGYRTVFVKYPKDRVTIIVFSNQDRAPMDVMTREISSMIFNGR